MYIYNPKSHIVHKTDQDGRTYESCNIDQISDSNKVKVHTLADLDPKLKYTLCKRCFR